MAMHVMYVEPSNYPFYFVVAHQLLVGAITLSDIFLQELLYSNKRHRQLLGLCSKVVNK